MIIKASCTNADCGLSLSIPVVEGGVLPTLDSHCKKCSSIVVVDSAVGNDEQQVSRKIPTAPSNSRAAHLIEYMKHFKNHPSKQTETSHFTGQFLSGFINRITPMFILVQLLDKLEQDGSPTELKHVIENWSLISQDIKEALIVKETTYSIRRGQRLSDGFPTSNPDKDGPMRIFLRNVLGCDFERLMKNRGYLQTLGIIEVIDSSTLSLTTKAEGILKLPDLVELVLNQNPIDNNGINWIPREVSGQIIDALFSIMPGERYWVLEILQSIRDGATDTYGWNSNQYAHEIVYSIAQGNTDDQNSRWIHVDGTPLFDHYYQRGLRFKADRSRKAKDKVKNPEEFAVYRLTNHINSNLGGLLGRAKELGLIFPIKVGREINFQLTEFGSKILEQYSTTMEEEQ